MKTVSILAVIAALAAGPVLAQDAPPAPAPAPAAPAAPVQLAPERDAAGNYQVIRITDSQMTCEQLVTEINALNATIKTQATQQARGAAGGRAARNVAGGAAAGALGGLGRGLIGRAAPGLGLVGTFAAAGASDAAANAVGGSIAGSGQPAAPATVSNEQQRFNRVNGLFASKGC